MKKIILGTSREAMAERLKRTNNTACPECGNPSFGTVTTRETGVFRVKMEKKHDYTCISCGCGWTNGWITQ